MASKNTAARMNSRENQMRDPNKSSVVKPASGKPKAKLVVAIGIAPTLGTRSDKAYNKNAGKIKR